MGSIRRAPRSNRWEARYRDPLGRQRTSTFPTRVVARTFLSAVETDMARGSWYDPALSKVTFAELAQEWLANNPRKRETTRARDADVIRIHLVPVLGVLPVGLLRRSHVQQVVETMEAKGLRAKTIRTNYGVLRAILSWGLEHDVIHRSPCRGIRLPEPDSTPRRIASAVDIERLVDAMPIDHRVTVLLGALGLRQAEVFGLRIASIDFLRRTLTVEHTINEVHGRFVEGRGKTAGSVRTISVPNRILDELAAHLTRTGRTNPNDLVVQSPTGGPVRASNFRLRVYNPTLAKLGLEGLSFHRLRHSAGHMMREAGVPLDVIQRRLGHASIRTTADIYGSLPESVDRAVAAKLDALFASACGADVVQGSLEPLSQSDRTASD